MPKKKKDKKKTPKNRKEYFAHFFFNSVCTEITLVYNKTKLILMSGSNSPYS